MAWRHVPRFAYTRHPVRRSPVVATGRPSCILENLTLPRMVSSADDMLLRKLAASTVDSVREVGDRFLEAGEVPGRVSMREGKPLSQSRKSAGKRDQIIRAAIEIINTKGFALATMSEIAASLDLRDAALYYYFPTKQALAYAGHVHSLERFERLLTVTDADGGSGAARLERFTRAMLDDSSRNGPHLYFGEHSYLDEEQRNAIDGWGDRLKGALERYFRDGMTDGSVVSCEPELVVQLSTSACSSGSRSGFPESRE